MMRYKSLGVQFANIEKQFEREKEEKERKLTVSVHTPRLKQVKSSLEFFSSVSRLHRVF